MNRKIVFVNQATGYLTIDIVNEFAGSFDKVALIAGSIRVQDDELNRKVQVSKIIRYNRESIVKKAFSWFIGSIEVFFLLLFKYRKYEVVFTTLPPTAYLFAVFMRRRKFSVLFYDIYPEALKILNLTENNLLYKLWAWLNKRILKRAFRIYTLSEGMKNQLINYAESNNILVVPNWSGLKFSSLNPDEIKAFRQQQGLQNRFVVQYSGNIGYSHRVEIIVELAKILHKEQNIYFIIIGRGERLEYINELIKTYNLHNCHTLPFQTDDRIKYTLSAADLSVVTLDERAPAMSVPSKVYNLLKVGSPIMGVGDAGSELARLLAEYNNGRNFYANQLTEMADFILELQKDPEKRNKYSNNSLSASLKYTSENSKRYLKSYLQIL
jgi:glycosyltransferase involved in cell wall biosynthesis